ncbi:MAG: hypothetical protein CMJ43_00970 [Phyllobacteriaceae bacterium]|nr:hypothetical protein [Phyllobacteriaceae bacterium]
MRKGNRDLVKGIAYRYGISQSEIMNTAPYLFIIMAERSLAERRGQLSAAKTLAEQARRSLGSLPKHLVLGDAEERIVEALALEEHSLSKNQVHGPDEGDIENFMQRGFMPFGDPFRETLIAALKEVGAAATVERYQAMLQGGEDEDTFLDEEEEAERAEFLEKILGNIDLSEINIDLGRQQSEGNEEAEGAAHSGPRIAKWQIIVKNDEIAVNTGADALEQFLKRLVSEDPAKLEKLRNVRGRVRPLIAQTTEQLYPGRPDLGDFAREFVPGWFVGTNYSHRDVMRLLRAAAEEVGLSWGVDVYVKATPTKD